MTRFADQLFADLMREYRPTLERIRTPPARARRAVPRPVWLAAGAVGLTGAVTAGVVVLGGGAAAYAVTQNSDGTVTVSLNEMSGVEGADTKLRDMSLPVVVVPVRPGCPAINTLPQADRVPAGGMVSLGTSGSITVNARGVPAGDTALVATSGSPRGWTFALAVIKGPAPSCVSLPNLPPGPGTPGPGSGSTSVGPGH